MDFSPLLSPVSESLPCGPDLEYDDAWSTKMNLLESKIAGEKKTTYEDGKLVELKTSPKWSEVKSSAYELCSESRTLRLGLILTECAFELEGITGLRDGLRMIAAWMEDWWDHLHPLPPQEAGEWRRPILNTMNHDRFVIRLRRIPVARSHGQSYSIQDIVQNEGSSGDSNLALLARQAIAAMDSSHRNTLVDAAKEAQESVVKICAVIRDKCEPKYALSLSELTSVLTDFQRYLAPEESGDQVTETAPSDESDEASPSATPAGNSAGRGLLLNDKASVRSGLESMIRFFERTEPSSPVPLILKRALRCIDMSFLQLLDEMAPTREEAVRFLRSPSDDTE